MGAEFLAVRTLRVESVENDCLLAGRNARALVFDQDHRMAVFRFHGDGNGNALWTERQRIGDQVSEYLG